MSELSYIEARDALLARAAPLGTETVPLRDAAGRVLAQSLIAAENVPAFDRSPYDGYAFRACDSAGASRDSPVTLRVLEELPAGSVPRFEVTESTATRLMTGRAPTSKHFLHFSGSQFHISRSGAGAVHYDGSPFDAGTEFDLEVQPRMLQVIVPHSKVSHI